MQISRRFRLGLGIVLAVLLLGTRPVASEPDMAEIEVLGEQPFQGRVRAVGLKRLEVIPAGKTEARELALEQVIEVRFPAPAGDPPAAAAHLVTLTDGSALRGTVSSAGEESFQLAVSGTGTARISFDVLRTLVALPSNAGPCTDLASTYKPASEGDVIHLQRGDDQINGTLTDADAKQVTFEDERGRARRVAWSDIRVMHLENDAPKPRAGVMGEVELMDGSRFVTSRPPLLAGSDLRFALHAAPEAVFTIPLRRVRALRYTGGAFVYLTALPYEATHTPHYPVPAVPDPAKTYERFSKNHFKERVDRRPRGCPLRVGGKTYRHGFAVTSKSVIRFELDEGYTSLQAVFGIDDIVTDDTLPRELRITAPGAGDVDARVLGDGKPLWEAKGVTLAAGPREIGPLDVSGVAVLELVVDFGKNLNTADLASWVNPILVRK